LKGDIDVKPFLAQPGQRIDLSEWATLRPDLCSGKHDYKRLMKAHVAALSHLQDLLYASNQYAVLLIFQALDSAGKDGAIKHVMSGVNPQGCQVFSYKHPSQAELQHDFLWRTTRDLPERGRIGIFNRSYYEEVLIARVHPEILHSEGLARPARHDRKTWRQRYESITNLERHLCRNGTRVLKFFLHLSPDEQRKRLLDRIDSPDKNWKFSAADVQERAFWPEYMTAYGQCLSATSTRRAPWYIVPADDKNTAHLIVSRIVLNLLESLPLHYPDMNAARAHELHTLREQLVHAAEGVPSKKPKAAARPKPA
jgi:PPK2 family polyphosphate:nucleotide phosphotransferase